MPRPLKTLDNDKVNRLKNDISEGVECILERRASQLSFSSIHSAVYQLISLGMVKYLHEILVNHLSALFSQWKISIQQTPDQALVQRFSSISSDFLVYKNIIPRIYVKFDEICHSQGLSSSTETIQNMFESVILSSRSFIATLSECMVDSLKILSQEDVPIADSLSIVYSVLASYAKGSRSKYLEEFHQKAEKNLRHTYSLFFESNFRSNPFSDFLQKAKKKIVHDIYILKSIASDDYQSLLEVIYQTVLFSKEDLFIEGENPPILDAIMLPNKGPADWLFQVYYQHERDPLRLYQTFADILNRDVVAFSSQFTDDLNTMNIVKLVAQIIDLIITRRDAFEGVRMNTKLASNYLKNSILSAWNSEGLSIVDNFNAYIDYHIRSQLKDYGDTPKYPFEVMCAYFYSVTTDKMAFKERYAAFFTRRLISSGLSNIEFENVVINEIRKQKSSDFMMIRDRLVESINVSNELESEFLKVENVPRNISIRPIVFSWADYALPKDPSKWLPDYLKTLNDSFNGFYSSKKQNCQLILLAESSTVEGKLKIPPNKRSRDTRNYTVVGDIASISIIKCVAMSKRISLQQILSELHFESIAIKKRLAVLCKAPTNVLRRAQSSGKTMELTDVFEINSEFVSRSLKFNIPPITSQRKIDNKIAEADAIKNKATIIQASMVRALKMKNKVTQSELEQIIIEDLRSYFKVEMSMLRNVINSGELTSSNINDPFFKREIIDGIEYLVYIQT